MYEPCYLTTKAISYKVDFLQVMLYSALIPTKRKNTYLKLLLMAVVEVVEVVEVVVEILF